MNFYNLSTGKKLVLVFLCLAWIAYVILMIYSLVYAGKETFYRKNIFVTGLGFFFITWVIRFVFKRPGG